ncbi:cobyric acid synthase [Zhenpiania hominis]|uniref:Cobyric acid synthase n=1 Tax=Zhenpiania hominis TaxID=2763644 RepID=A0A923NKQ1_9FIRM|nr:cobyric acid synthase [Zhenpiania hominis]MBC6678395.1 cobyric acid synthase [Zhenpiania hominis]
MAKAIMIQGTMSNAGKSLVAAGLCRIFKQDGYKVAPFKAQNMALNSFITREGLEMGRAQVTQAEAAGVEPSVLMNPILLKPTNDTSSQVIVNGEVMDNLSAADYYKRKRDLVAAVKDSYDKLAAEHDIIVLEGAGSPAEINLKENDIVNMYMAKLAKAPVLLVGDIDRGGVFASIVGTMQLFEPEERELVKGILINKFRGDRSILQLGLDQLSEIIQKPIAGVIPYMHLDIDDEDSLTERFTRKGEAGLVDLAVIRVPRISNFTDFNVLESMPGVTVRYVDSAAALGDPDLILLPGTKNTMADLLWMRQNGLESCIHKHAAAGKPVFGICGGYQMLGRVLKDPHGVEHGGEMAGIGLLPSVTVFEEEKTRTRVTGTFRGVEGIFSGLSGIDFEGYEIHMGTSSLEEGNVLADIAEDGAPAKADGLNSGNVYGSYVHGIFDREEVAKSIISALLRAKGLSDEDVVSTDMAAYKEQQYDLLADGIRRNMDMDLLYRIVEQGA